MNELEQLKARVKLLEDIISKIVKSDRMMIEKNMQFMDGRKIFIGGTSGTTIGQSASKLAVLGATPVARATAITAPSGGATVDSQARTAINSLITAVKNFGITL